MAKAASPIHLERKVVLATVLAAAATAALEIVKDENLMHYVPVSLQPFARVLLPVLATFLGGYVAKHSLRDDIEELEREVGLAPAAPAPKPVAIDVQTVQVAQPAPEAVEVEGDVSGDGDGPDDTEGR